MMALLKLNSNSDDNFEIQKVKDDLMKKIKNALNI